MCINIEEKIEKKKTGKNIREKDVCMQHSTRPIPKPGRGKEGRGGEAEEESSRVDYPKYCTRSK